VSSSTPIASSVRDILLPGGGEVKPDVDPATLSKFARLQIVLGICRTSTRWAKDEQASLLMMIEEIAADGTP